MSKSSLPTPKRTWRGEWSLVRYGKHTLLENKEGRYVERRTQLLFKRSGAERYEDYEGKLMPV